MKKIFTSGFGSNENVEVSENNKFNNDKTILQ